ncbi:hypothetical protein DRN73_01875 [Candidatus Pacearchaeota archaeon]|nr:MAG: hypothetical protein DRN73_01875 [Candidatus Pacearchaeota archaeon]
MKKDQKYIGIFLFFLILIILSNFSINKVKGRSISSEIKRGYILDKNFEPIVISIQNYKAYYVLKNEGIFKEKIPSVIRKYIPTILNLPQNGVILLSDNLSFDEIEKIKEQKNVIIEKEFKRKLLYPYLKFLIGTTFDGYGVSGLEKIFDEKLQKGETLTLSIDLNLENRIYSLSKKLDFNSFAIAIFDLEKAQLIGYFENSEENLFKRYLPVILFNIPAKEFTEFKWGLGKEKIIKNNITYINLWHLAKWIIDKKCNENIIPTILYSPQKVCYIERDFKDKEEEYIYKYNNQFIVVSFKNKKLYILTFKINSEKLASKISQYNKDQFLKKAEEIIQIL